MASIKFEEVIEDGIIEEVLDSGGKVVAQTMDDLLDARQCCGSIIIFFWIRI